MTEAVKGKKVAEALELSRKFQAMVVEGAPRTPPWATSSPSRGWPSSPPG